MSESVCLPRVILSSSVLFSAREHVIFSRDSTLNLSVYVSKSRAECDDWTDWNLSELIEKKQIDTFVRFYRRVERGPQGHFLVYRITCTFSRLLHSRSSTTKT